MRDADVRQVNAWSEQLARNGSVTLGLSRRYQLMFGVGGVVFVALGAIFFAREGSGLPRLLAGLATVWGVLLIFIVTLPRLRRHFEIVVDYQGVQTTGPFVPWVDLDDVVVGSISARQAVLLQAKEGALSGQSAKLSPGQNIYLPYTLPSSPNALATWLADEARARGQGQPDE